MSRVRIAAFSIVFAMAAVPAFADVTAFVGTNTTPASRITKGAAIGLSLAVVGLEFEYAVTDANDAKSAPELKTGMANGFVQPPLPFFGLTPYVTAGGGVYRETLGLHQDTGFGLNVGGGVKLRLAGPLQLRADYRVFKLGGDALNSPAHRLYVGLNLKF